MKIETFLPHYIRLNKDLTNIDYRYQKGLTFALAWNWLNDSKFKKVDWSYITRDANLYCYSISIQEVMDNATHFDILTREDIDKIKIDKEESDLFIQFKLLGTFSGVWIDKPYRHFIEDEGEATYNPYKIFDSKES